MQRPQPPHFVPRAILELRTLRVLLGFDESFSQQTYSKLIMRSRYRTLELPFLYFLKNYGIGPINRDEKSAH